MTIHSDFWNDRHRVRTGFGGNLNHKRDSKRQRCYDWENKHLRPQQSAFETRQAAKGYARLCAKVAIRHMQEIGLIQTEAVAEGVRKSFMAAFTKERLRHCNANATGAYFAAWGWTDVIIAHEVAHWADQWAHKLSVHPFKRADYIPHGPNWLGWFGYILANAGMRRVGDRQTVLAHFLNTLEGERLKASLPYFTYAKEEA